VENVTDRSSNPFGMVPPCRRFVPGYGDANADFHVIGDHPGIHGGADAGAASAASADRGEDPAGASPLPPDRSGAEGEDESGPESPPDEGAVGYPFTNAAGMGLQRALVEAGLLDAAGGPPTVESTFLSYLHACVPDEHGNGNEHGHGHGPTATDYDDLERFFDAELRAIAAHVLLPVGRRAIRHVLAEYTAEPVDRIEPESLHATEVRGGGWLVVPVAEPAGWTDADRRALVEALVRLRRTDFRRESDLGRFLPGGDPYYVR